MWVSTHLTAHRHACTHAHTRTRAHTHKALHNIVSLPSASASWRRENLVIEAGICLRSHINTQDTQAHKCARLYQSVWHEDAESMNDSDWLSHLWSMSFIQACLTQKLTCHCTQCQMLECMYNILFSENLCYVICIHCLQVICGSNPSATSYFIVLVPLSPLFRLFSLDSVSKCDL